MKCFKDVNTLEELRRQYKELLKKYHPTMQMEKDNTFVAYEDNNYLLMTDCANNIVFMKNAILKMLQSNIYFDIDWYFRLFMYA